MGGVRRRCLPGTAASSVRPMPSPLQNEAIAAAATATSDAIFKRADPLPGGKEGAKIKAGQNKEVSRRS